MPKPGARRPEALLRVDHLDGDDQREEDQRDRLRRSAAAGRARSRRAKRKPAAEALSQPLRLDLRRWAGRASTPSTIAIDHERRRVDQQRRREPDLRDQQAAERRTAHRRPTRSRCSAARCPHCSRRDRLQDARDRAARERARRHRDARRRRAPSTRTERQDEAAVVRDQRQGAEDERLDHVERRQRRGAASSLVEPGRQTGAISAGRNLRGEEERRRGRHRLGLVIDEDAPARRCPTLSPSSLTVYDASRRPNGLTDRGSTALPHGPAS